jgi:hypothetical protein
VQHLTLLYTARLRGQLDRLPRLFATIRQAQAQARQADREGDTATTLIDLGESCAPEVWECQATEGRAGLVVLDMMGYAAVCLSAPETRRMGMQAAARLQAQVALAVCGSPPGWPEAATWRVGDWQLALVAEGAPESALPPDAHLIVRRLDSGETRLEPAVRTLWLAPPEAGETPQLGRVRIGFDADRQPVTLAVLAPLPTGSARPDATVAAAVEFVRDEARHYQRAQHKGGAHATDRSG